MKIGERRDGFDVTGDRMRWWLEIIRRAEPEGHSVPNVFSREISVGIIIKSPPTYPRISGAGHRRRFFTSYPRFLERCKPSDEKSSLHTKNTKITDHGFTAQGQIGTLHLDMYTSC